MFPDKKVSDISRTWAIFTYNLSATYPMMFWECVFSSQFGYPFPAAFSQHIIVCYLKDTWVFPVHWVFPCDLFVGDFTARKLSLSIFFGSSIRLPHPPVHPCCIFQQNSSPLLPRIQRTCLLHGYTDVHARHSQRRTQEFTVEAVPSAGCRNFQNGV